MRSRFGGAAAACLVAVALLAMLTAGAAGAAVRSFTVPGAGGVRIHAWVTAAGRGAPTLIVINGGPGVSHAAEPPAQVLAPQYRVVFYDQRGTGRSRLPRVGAVDMPRQVADLDAVRRGLGAARIDLLGHSWGGLIAAAYAARYPAHVHAVVLADAEPADAVAAAQGSALLGQRIAALMAQGVIPRTLPPVIGDDCTAQFNAYTPAYLSNPRLAVPLLPRGACRQSTMLQTNAAQTPAVRDAVLAGLRRYRGRVLVVFGRDDPFRPAFQPADLAELPIARVQLTVLPHAGHVVWAESKRFFPIVRRFLAT